jgi:PAS domain S-box-containing protein
MDRPEHTSSSTPSGDASLPEHEEGAEQAVPDWAASERHTLRGGTETDDTRQADVREQRLRSLINRLPGAVYRCTYDTEWKSLYMGAGFADICGIPPETLDPAGRSFKDVIVPEDVPRIKDAVADAVARREYYSIEYRIVANDGSTRWVEDNGRPTFADGSVQWLEGILLDITDRKEARESLRRMNETLEDEVETRTRQVRALAAELAMVEQRERSQIARTLHDELQQFLYGLQVQAKMLVDSIQSHPDIDGQSLPVDPSHVETLLQQAISTTRGLTVSLSPPVLDSDGLLEALQWLRSHMAQAHDLEVALQGELPELDIQKEVRMVVVQAVRELLMNVHQHADVDHARIEMSEECGTLTITVSDDGVGFDVDTELARKHAGYGLRTAAERLRLLGGTFQVDSAPNQGTRCTIRLSQEKLQNVSISLTGTIA